MTRPDAPPEPARAPVDPDPSAPHPVTGWGATLDVCVRTAVILLVPAALALAWFAANTPAPEDRVGLGTGVRIVALAYAVHIAATFALGWPAGTLTAHLVRHRTSETAHVLAFAACGAALGVLTPLLLAALVERSSVTLALGIALVLAVVYCPVGAAVAAAARAWAGRAHRRRRRASPPVPSVPSP